MKLEAQVALSQAIEKSAVLAVVDVHADNYRTDPLHYFIT